MYFRTVYLNSDSMQSAGLFLVVIMPVIRTRLTPSFSFPLVLFPCDSFTTTLFILVARTCLFPCSQLLVLVNMLIHRSLWLRHLTQLSVLLPQLLKPPLYEPTRSRHLSITLPFLNLSFGSLGSFLSRFLRFSFGALLLKLFSSSPSPFYAIIDTGPICSEKTEEDEVAVSGSNEK